MFYSLNKPPCCTECNVRKTSFLRYCFTKYKTPITKKNATYPFLINNFIYHKQEESKKQDYRSLFETFNASYR